MKRKHKSYSKPKRPFDKARIDEEAKIKAEYGLKNKKEIWKAEAKINSMREKAKKLVRADESEKQKLFDKLNKIGLKVESLAEVLSLNIRDFLERRLQTVLVRKNMAPTMKTARQFITHKKVLVDGRIVNIPSYIVPVALENKLQVKISNINMKAPDQKQGEKAEPEKSETEKDFEAALPKKEAEKVSEEKETEKEVKEEKSEEESK